MSGDKNTQAIDAAINAVWQLRSAERLLASSGFYSEAASVREQRERVERCSVSSVEELSPDHGNYSPRTIGAEADHRKERDA